jgi:photosystem II stability/assembly factor-like uncharacterized protein
MQGSQAPGGAQDEQRQVVLRLETQPSAAPCNTFWEKGSAPDARHAWIDLHATSDGGATWRVVKFSAEAGAAMHLHGILNPSDDSIGAIESWFITGTRGWLVVLRKEETPTWETDDGARTLRSLPGWYLSTMTFADARHGVALVANHEHELEPMLSADAGATWQRCGVKYTSTYFDFLFMLDARRGWAWVGAPGSRWDAPWNDGGRDAPLLHGVMRTDDGGCHWRGAWGARDLIAERGALYFLNEKDGWLGGGYRGGLYHTADGGSSWQLQPLPKDQMEIKGVFFRDADHGWLFTGKEELFETRDAGLTWRHLTRSEVLARLEELMSSWERWPMGKLYGMLARGGCFAPESLQHRLER